MNKMSLEKVLQHVFSDVRKNSATFTVHVHNRADSVHWDPYNNSVHVQHHVFLTEFPIKADICYKK